MDEAHRAANAAQVSVRHGLGSSRRPIAVVHVSGEHDFTSRGLLWAALEPLNGDVVVDLTRCTFIDISVIGAILGKALDLGKDGYRLELVCLPPRRLHARSIDYMWACCCPCSSSPRRSPRRDRRTHRKLESIFSACSSGGDLLRAEPRVVRDVQASG
jgi:hypothetical protein